MAERNNVTVREFYKALDETTVKWNKSLDDKLEPLTNGMTRLENNFSVRLAAVEQKQSTLEQKQAGTTGMSTGVAWLVAVSISAASVIVAIVK